MAKEKTMSITVCDAQMLRNDVSWMKHYHENQLKETTTPNFRSILQERIEAEADILTKLNEFLNV